ncbi:MAG: autoinducer 2 ABC transporter substrate-binding protein, partial [Spirochaetales bacterium]|nr:autoinducer 2 ABC transporter substrate-binding protein [Spirochaetales bacterium]
GLVDKAFTSGTGMPLDNAALLESGIVKSLTLWDPALAGKAMISLAIKVLDGDDISGVVDLGVDGYTAMRFKAGSPTVLEGEGWIVINKDNVYDFGF